MKKETNINKTKGWVVGLDIINFKGVRLVKIDVEFIDNKGFWHRKTAKSKKLLLQWLGALIKGTEIRWKSKSSVFVSQQYVRR